MWYYGKNKVLQHKFAWNYVETDNFKIYYYTKNKALVKKLTIASEKAYRKISDYLNLEIKKKIPMIYYNSHIDFELTNI